MGITTPIQNSPSLALGTFEVKVIDMAVAYSAIANGGYATWPYAIKEIYSRDGYQLYMRESDGENQILDGKAVENMADMLEDVIKFGTGRRAKLPFLPPENRNVSGLSRRLVRRLYRQIYRRRLGRQ